MLTRLSKENVTRKMNLSAKISRKFCVVSLVMSLPLEPTMLLTHGDLRLTKGSSDKIGTSLPTSSLAQ